MVRGVSSHMSIGFGGNPDGRAELGTGAELLGTVTRAKSAGNKQARPMTDLLVVGWRVAAGRNKRSAAHVADGGQIVWRCLTGRCLYWPLVSASSSMAEQRTLNPQVQGSTPWGRTTKHQLTAGFRRRRVVHDHGRSDNLGDKHPNATAGGLRALRAR